MSARSTRWAKPGESILHTNPSCSCFGTTLGELLALRVCDLDFEANAIQVKHSSDQRNGGKIGPCKNVTAYRSVHLGDAEGMKAMARLKRFLELYAAPSPEVLGLSLKTGGPL